MKIFSAFLLYLAGSLQLAVASLCPDGTPIPPSGICSVLPPIPGATVPEPSVYLLILSGVIGLGIVKYLRRNK